MSTDVTGGIHEVLVAPAGDTKITAVLHEVLVSRGPGTQVIAVLHEVLVGQALGTQVNAVLHEVLVADAPPGIFVTGILHEAMVSQASGTRLSGVDFEVLVATGGLYRVDSIDQPVLGSDGGVLVTATGVFPISERVKVTLTNSDATEVCYSGILGNAEWGVSKDGLTLPFVTPPLPEGVYAIQILTEDSAFFGESSTADLTIIHQSFTSALYGIRSAMADPRKVGPHSIHEEK